MFAYDGRSRVLEIQFRVTTPYTPGDIPLSPPPRVIQYFNVSRYVFTRLTRCNTARQQERHWEDIIQRRFASQTVRTVCRLPRIRRFSEARNIRRHIFEDYVLRMAGEDQPTFRVIVAAMKLVLLRTLAPKRFATLGGLIECQCCGRVGPRLTDIRHRNCLWVRTQMRLRR